MAQATFDGNGFEVCYLSWSYAAIILPRCLLLEADYADERPGSGLDSRTRSVSSVATLKHSAHVGSVFVSLYLKCVGPSVVVAVVRQENLPFSERCARFVPTPVQDHKVLCA